MVTIAVDAMGGDDAPKAEVEGAIRAVRSLGVRVILVGKQDIVRAELGKHENGRPICPSKCNTPASSVTMDDSVAKPCVKNATAPSMWRPAWCATA